MSLNFPKVDLGKRCPFIKQERRNADIHVSLSLSGADFQFKKERDPSPSPPPSRLSCSICCHCAPHLSILFISDPRREEHFRSLLRSRREEEEEGDLTFCSVCREAVTRLLQLRE